MADVRVVRASFRALLRAARRLEAQAARARTTAGRVFTEEEVAELERLAPARGAEAMRDASRARDVVRREFRGASTDDAHLAERLDASLVALGIARRRARRLEDMASETRSETTTEGVRVRVKASLVPSQTSPEVNRYVYAYDVEITNVGNDEAVQVVSREWRVVDEDGNVECVQGRGVVGEQPVLGVGESFHYSSACALRRIRGTMRGKYVCATQESKRVFEAEIGAFALMPPRKGASELTVDEDEDEDDEDEDEDLEALTRDSAINIR
jgi:ApaG protein